MENDLSDSKGMWQKQNQKQNQNQNAGLLVLNGGLPPGLDPPSPDLSSWVLLWAPGTLVLLEKVLGATHRSFLTSSADGTDSKTLRTFQKASKTSAGVRGAHCGGS